MLAKADPHAKDELYQDFEFIDDVSGRVLDHELAAKARKLEMDFFRKMRDGCRVISTKWVDINKGNQKAPNCRARSVGRELMLDSRHGLAFFEQRLHLRPSELSALCGQTISTANNRIES